MLNFSQIIVHETHVTIDGTFYPSDFFSVDPYITEQPESVTVTSMNETLELFCEGTGFPVPEILWFRLESSAETMIDSDANGAVTISFVTSSEDLTIISILTIASPSISDSGEYFCVLSSSVAAFSEVMSGIATVMVQGK